MGSGDVLDTIKIVSPCTVPWASMAGDERVRHCGQCKKDVYNVAAMTGDEARAVIEKAEGRVCLRLARRADGTVVTGDCRARLRAARQRGMIVFAGTLVVMLAVEVWAQAFGLRALSDFLRGDSHSPSITPDEIDRAPVVHSLRPKRSSLLALLNDDDHIVMGSVLATAPRQGKTLDELERTDGSPRLFPPSLAALQKKSGEDPPFPPSLQVAGTDTPVVVRVCVSKTGSVESVTPFREQNPQAEGAVVKTVKQWSYRPLVIKSVAVPFCTILRFNFRASESAAARGEGAGVR